LPRWESQVKSESNSIAAHRGRQPADRNLGSAGPRYASGMALAGAGAHKIPRNTCLLLALTTMPTIVGACLGIAIGAVIMLQPIAAALIVLGAERRVSRGKLRRSPATTERRRRRG
jgi:hypothetical protein